ncbi:MAG: AI-2E family transporter [Armatimonadetes bacterium]|nr:AI-2E family transporter [Armatimonadota bacterium]
MENTRVYIANLRATALWVIGIVLLLRFIDAVATLTLIFALILVLAMVLHPAVTWLEQRRCPRGLAAVLVTTAFIGLFAGAAALMLPVTVRQSMDFGQQIQTQWPQWRDRAIAWLHRYPELEGWINGNIDSFSREITPHLSRLLLQFGRYTLNVVAALIATSILYVMVIFVLAQPEPLVRGLLGAVPEQQRQATKRALQRAMKQVQAWAGATAFNMVAIGLLTWAGLRLIRLPHAELFAILAGILEALPTIGPILSAIPPLLVAISQSPLQVLLVAILFVLIQQGEANLLAPMVLARQTQLHPLTVVFALLTMGALGGVLGAVLAIPLVSVVKAIYEEFYYKRKITDERALDEDVFEVLGTTQAARRRENRARRGKALLEAERAAPKLPAEAGEADGDNGPAAPDEK